MTLETYRQGVDNVLKSVGQTPDLAVILGSGLGGFANRLHKRITIDTRGIPGYPTFTVEGHPGRIVHGYVANVRVLAFQGRIHHYECGNYEWPLFPVVLSHQLGLRRLIITNTAGGINRSFSPRDLMVIVDHMNFMDDDPLRPFQFPPEARRHTPCYSPTLIDLAQQAASEIGLPLQTGVYCGVKGPSYETAAEIEMLHRLGADAVGMSTVPEATLAHQLGVEVLGISLISNMATGIAQSRHTHTEVTSIAKIAGGNLSKLLVRIMTTMTK